MRSRWRPLEGSTHLRSRQARRKVAGSSPAPRPARRRKAAPKQAPDSQYLQLIVVPSALAPCLVRTTHQKTSTAVRSRIRRLPLKRTSHEPGRSATRPHGPNDRDRPGGAVRRGLIARAAEQAALLTRSHVTRAGCFSAGASLRMSGWSVQIRPTAARRRFAPSAMNGWALSALSFGTAAADPQRPNGWTAKVE